jgi:hypothetical protein
MSAGVVARCVIMFISESALVRLKIISLTQRKLFLNLLLNGKISKLR